MDPISTELTKKALESISDSSIANAANAKPQPQAYEVEQSSFGKIFDQQVGSQNAGNQALVDMVDQIMGNSPGGGGSMNAIAANGIQVDVTKVGEIQPGSGNSQDVLGNLLSEVNNSQNNMDKLLEQLNSGKQFTPQELLRLQVFTQNHAVTYEMVTKFGEMGNQAIQKTFTMQV